MEATNNSMDFLDARDCLRLLNRVDYAAMAARGKNDETFALDQKVSRDFVLEIIRDESASIFRW
jgi:hypothetical protein